MRLALLLSIAIVAGCATPSAEDVAPTAGSPQVAEQRPHEWTLDEERELLRGALHVHLEHGHHDAAHLIEHGLHARELAVSGRTDEEALHVRRTAPKTEMLRRQLRRAAEILVDAGKHDLAARMAALSDDLWDDSLAGTEQPRPPRDDAHDREIQVVKERMKILRWGVEIWVEKGRHDLAEKLELAIVAWRMAIERRRDAEANEIRERAPDPGTLAELLHGAGRHYDEKGWETRAAACFELSEEFGRQWRRRQQREGEREHRGVDEERMRRLMETLERFMVRTEELEERVRHLTERLEHLETRDR